MSVFSFTAPHVSPAEEQREMAALTDQERQELYDDINGCAADKHNAMKETPEQITEAHRLVHEAIDQMEAAPKRDYLEACHRVPDLVRTESDVTAYMRCEHYNAWAAARRLVDYWTARVHIFGNERAFQPMTLAGAMAADVNVLEKGIAQVLPDDCHGRAVLYWDRIRSVQSVASRESVARCLFYCCQKIAAHVSAQRNGYLWLINCKGYDLYLHFDRMLARRIFKFVYTMPMNFRGLHFFNGPGKSALNLTMPIFKHMGGKYYRLRFIHHAGSDKEILARLATYGLIGQHLAAIVALTTPSDYCRHWLDAQKFEEQNGADPAKSPARNGQLQP